MVKERINWSDPDVVTFPDISGLKVKASTFPVVEITSFAVDVFEVWRMVTVDGEEVEELFVLDSVSTVSETSVVVLVDWNVVGFGAKDCVWVGCEDVTVLVRRLVVAVGAIDGAVAAI